MHKASRVEGRGPNSEESDLCPEKVGSRNDSVGFITESRPRLHLWSILLVLIVLGVGCSEEEPAPAEATEQQESVAEEAPEVESVEPVDDERSLQRRIEDAAIATQVRIALVDASELRRFDFDPEVSNGRVVLRGEVNTQDQRSRAEVIAKEVQGVRGVTNEITALEEPSLASKTPDTATEDTSDQVAQAEPDGPDAQTAPPSQTAEATSQPQQQRESQQQQKQSEPQQQEQATYHTVKTGESLWTISRNYDVTIEQIRRLNNLSSNNLRPGQRLQVK